MDGMWYHIKATTFSFPVHFSSSQLLNPIRRYELFHVIMVMSNLGYFLFILAKIVNICKC